MTKYIIGIDLGGTNLKIGLLDKRYNILSKNILSTKKFRSKDSLIGAIVKAVKEIIEKRRLKKSDILGIGLGLPGPVDTSKGIVHFFPNIPGWHEVGLKGILRKKLKIPVFIDNDANLMCLAEHRIGAARNSQNAVCITLGTGVGGGLIINKELYRGSSFGAGEIGHMPINEVGPRCACRASGCLEAYIGNNVILKNARRAFHKNISLEDLSRMANKGNKKAIRLWLDVSRHLAVALAGVINLLNPDSVVVGGGVANAGRVLFERLKQAVKMRAMSVHFKGVKILPACLGSDAGIIGAAVLVKESL